MPSFCRSCKAEIRWKVHEVTRRRMPIDAEASPDGNIAIDGEVARVLPKGSPYDGPRYKSHFATCPHAGEHRRG